MKFEKLPANNKISHSVIAYISYSEIDSKPIIDTYYPNGKTAIVFHFKDPIYFKNKDDEWTLMQKISFISFVTMPVALKMKGALDTLAILMQPYAIYNVFGIKLDINARSSEAEFFFPADLYKELKLCETLPDRARILDNYFIKILKGYSPEKDKFKKMCDHIILKNGLIERKELAEKFSLSENYLHKLFIKRIGLSIKPFSQIIRISTIIEELHYSNSNDWFEILVKYGYYDQSHFIKDFKKITNQTPYQYFRYDNTISSKLSGLE